MTDTPHRLVSAPPMTNTYICDSCASKHHLSAGEVHRDGRVFARYRINLHEDSGEVTVDGMLEPEVEGEGVVTFSSRLGVDAEGRKSFWFIESLLRDSPLFGDRLSVERATTHPRQADYWALVQYVSEVDPLLRPLAHG